MKINGKTVSSEADILSVLDAVASGEEEFAILAKSPKRFIQTSGNMLEYNSGQKLYSAGNIANEDIKAAFLDYFRGNDGYKKFFRKTYTKAEKETFSDIVRETWHDFLDICIFTTLRFSQDRIYCGIALSSWIFYSVFIFAGIFLFAVYPQSHPDTPALWLGGGAFLFLIGFVILLGNLLRKRAKIQNGIFYPDSDYGKEPFSVSEIECIWIRKDNMHCQLGVLHRGDFSLLATYPSGQALKHGCKLAELWNKPLKFGDRYREIAKSQILMTALMLPFLFFFLYGYWNTIPKLQGVAASKNWIKTPATVVKSELQLRDAQSAYSRTPVLPHQRKAVRIEYKMANKKEAYLLCFEYQFRHNDGTVVGNSYSYFTDIPTNNGLKYLQKIVDDNPVGKEIFCYVNPEIRTLNVVNRSILWVYFMPHLTMLFIGILFIIAVSKRLYELILGMIYQSADSSAKKTKRKSIFWKNKRWYCGDSSYSSHRLIFSEDRITVRPSWVRAVVFSGYGASLAMICSLCLLSDYAIRQYGEIVFCVIALLFVGILLSYLFLRSYPEIDLRDGIFYPYGKRGSVFSKKFVAIPLENVSAIDWEHHSYISRHNCFECFTLLLVVPNGGRNYRYMLLNHGDYPTFMTDAEKLSKRLALPLPDTDLEDFNSKKIRRFAYIALLVYPLFIFIAVGHMNLAFREKNLFLITLMVIVLASLIYSLFKIAQALKGK